MKEHWEYLAAIIALGVGVWGQVKSLGAWARSLFIRTVWVDSMAAFIVASYANSKQGYRAREGIFSIGAQFVRPLRKYQKVAYEWLGHGRSTLWIRRRPIWLKRDKDAPYIEYQYKVEFLRGTLNFDQLLEEASAWYNRVGGHESGLTRHTITYHHGSTLSSEMGEGQRVQGRSAVEEKFGNATSWRFIGWRAADIGRQEHRGKLCALTLDPELTEVARKLGLWVKSKDWYADRGIPYRRGLLLKGVPGTGKTSFLRGIAEEHDLPVHIMDLATMSNMDLRKAWDKAVQTAPCMIVVEDIDAVFEGRENVSKGMGLVGSGGLTFDALLNCIDGMGRVDGVIVGVTTNHPDLVDAALLDRPGRIDHVVEFKPLGREERRRLAVQILDDEGLATLLADQTEDMPAAHFCELCYQRALERFDREQRAAEQTRFDQAPELAELFREVDPG